MMERQVSYFAGRRGRESLPKPHRRHEELMETTEPTALSSALASRNRRLSSTLYLILITGVAALGGLLFGYDTAVISGAIGLLQVHFALTAAATGWAASSALAGCVLGAALAGNGNDRYGRHRMLLIAGVCFFVSAIGTALASSFTVFILFRILGGVGVGTASVTSPLYIGESAPAKWRGRLVALNQLAIVAGMLIIYFVNYRIHLSGTPEWNQTLGWRWMFASGIVPSALLLGLLFVVPETARFLLMHGRRQEAERVAARTGAETLEEIMEAEEQQPATTTQLRRVLTVGLVLAVLQQVTGINVFLYYAPAIFGRVTHSGDVSLRQTVVLGAVNVVFTVLAMFFVDRAGRKPLLIAGSLGMALCLLAMGWAIMHESASAWLLLFVIVYIACFALSVGPVTWIVLSEIFPSAFRAKAIAISTAALWFANFIVSQTFPMLDENRTLVAHFGHGFPFFLYAGFCIAEIWFVWRNLPETKNRSLEEISRWWSVEA
jgi:MFS transporter, SP family, xylose:H+ symportor